MTVTMRDSDADRFLCYAVAALVVSCIHPLLGLLMQFPAIIYLTWKCDIKALPALMVLMLSKGNVRLFGPGTDFAIRMGITLTPASCFSIVAFLFAIRGFLSGRYTGRAGLIGGLWVVSVIPALVISMRGRQYGLIGAWSGPIMDFLVPSIYFWGISMAKTYLYGRDYFANRMLLCLACYMFFWALGVLAVHNFFTGPMMFCLAIYFWHRQTKTSVKVMICVGVLLCIYIYTFARGKSLEADAMQMYMSGRLDGEVASGDRYGSTFSAMASLFCAIALSLGIGRIIGKALMRMLPVIMFIMNVLIVSFVITTQSGNNEKEVSFKYETFSERFKWKLFGDRGFVWSMGWEEVKTPPLVFKDMRQAYVYEWDGRQGVKLLPHNQFLTLLARRGLWLGGFLSFFIIWVWVRACKAASYCIDDDLIIKVFVATGLSLYFVIGTAGQGVVTSSLWADALCCLVLPGVVYGHWQDINYRRGFVVRGA